MSSKGVTNYYGFFLNLDFDKCDWKKTIKLSRSIKAKHKADIVIKLNKEIKEFNIVDFANRLGFKKINYKQPINHKGGRK